MLLNYIWNFLEQNEKKLLSLSTCLSIDKSYKTKKWEKVIY